MTTTSGYCKTDQKLSAPTEIATPCGYWATESVISDAHSPRTSRASMHILPLLFVMAHMSLLMIPPVIGSLNSGIQSNGTTSAATPPGSNNVPFGGQAKTVYHNEIATLWKDLSALSETAAASIANDKRTAVQALTSSNGSLDLLAANSNSTNAQNIPPEEDEGSLIIGVITLFTVIFVIGFCGNSLVILVIQKFTKIETVTDIYILNLAFADLMYLSGLIILIITMHLGHFIFGNIMCKLYMASTSINQFASSLLLVVMSFDRFLAVCHPIYAQRFRRLKRAKSICFCIWIVCLILMTPIFTFARTNVELTCAIFWPEYKGFNCEIAFTMYSFAIGFSVPLLLIAAFYICVIRKLRIAASGPINLNSRRTRSRETANRRIEHLVIGIICTYTICWLPYWTAQLYVSFTTSLDRSPIPGFYPFVLIAQSLTYTNSASNPILYAFLSDNFKRRCVDVFRSILSVKWCQGTHSSEVHSTVATALYEPSEVNTNNNIIINNNNNIINNNNNNSNSNSNSNSNRNSNSNSNNNSNNNNNNCTRPESRQTVIMNESVRLVTSKSQLGEILTTEMGVDCSGVSHRIGNNTGFGGAQHFRHSHNQQPQMRRSVETNHHMNETRLGNNMYNYTNHDERNENHSRESSSTPSSCSADISAHANVGSLFAPSPSRKKSVAFNIETLVVLKSSSSPKKELIGDDRNSLQVAEASKRQQISQAAV